MTETEWRVELAQPVRTLRIIVIALIMGVVSFLAVSIAVTGVANRLPQGNTAYLMLGIAGFMVIGRVVVSGWIGGGAIQNLPQMAGPTQGGGDRGDRHDDVRRLFGLYQTKTIIAAAQMEGAAMLVLVAHLMDGSAVLVAAAVALLVGLALHFPTTSGVEHWIEERLPLVGRDGR